MANNFNGFWSSVKDHIEPALNTNDLVVGDRLIKVNMRYDWTEQVYEVVKILKNRLVIRPVDPRPGQKDLRVIVENNKTWTYNNGKVSTRIEGDRNSYSSPVANLFTLDDTELTKLRDRHEAEEARKEARIIANAAIAAFKQSLSIENAEEAIVALQAWVAVNKKETK